MVKVTLIDRVIFHIVRYYGSLLGILGRAVTLPFLWGFEYIFEKCSRKVVNSPEMHARKLKHAQEQISTWNKNGRRTKLCTGRPGWQSMCLRTPAYKDSMTGIDLSKLDDIIQIDEEAMTITVEPLVTMGHITRFLTPKGLMIPVVPEFDFLTVGGLVCGAGVETSSQKYGLFHNTCVSFEVLLCSGEVVTCSEGENSDLFYAMPGSYGTIGFLTAATIRLIKAEKFVKLSYLPVNSLDEASQAIRKESLKNPGHDFVEGIMYSLHEGVIMVGSFTSKAEPGKINPVNRWYKKSFYKHVQDLSHSAPSVEYIPLRDYYHRHTYGIFWMTHILVPYIDMPVMRWLFGWTAAGETNWYKLIPPSFRQFSEKIVVVQDFIVPIEITEKALTFFNDQVEIYPVWLCPSKSFNEPGFFKFDEKSDTMQLDIGIYGVPKNLEDYELVKSNKIFEQFCLQNKCWKGLYADTFLTRDEFYEMFDPTLYNKVRKQLDCLDAFPDVYEKISGRI
ncbi:delta(24)-sterol reductase [Folsomia candida]|uniref:delta(24)-sterol reductase n=1 Tax=Folsomia candida TaxID=158441 RepID=UPI0016054DC8|nr:delta(24)-sterol reductase [Folsomia candida]